MRFKGLSDLSCVTIAGKTGFFIKCLLVSYLELIFAKCFPKQNALKRKLSFFALVTCLAGKDEFTWWLLALNLLKIKEKKVNFFHFFSCQNYWKWYTFWRCEDRTSRLTWAKKNAPEVKRASRTLKNAVWLTAGMSVPGFRSHVKPKIIEKRVWLFKAHCFYLMFFFLALLFPFGEHIQSIKRQKDW